MIKQKIQHFSNVGSATKILLIRMKFMLHSIVFSQSKQLIMKEAGILLFLFLLSFIGRAQNQVIDGNIFAFNKYPLKNVVVKAKKSKEEVITDVLGMFSITVKKNDIIKITAVGFEDYSLKVKGKDNSLKVNLIYIVNHKYSKGYLFNDHIGETELKYGLNHLSSENNPYSHFIDIYAAIKDALPNATMIRENGYRRFQFRGSKSLTRSNAALFVVNGVKTDDISYIRPEQIKSIVQLSLTSTALYGPGAQNGVISITLI